VEAQVTTHSILWRGSYLPGHEVARLFLLDDHWHLTGTAVFSHEERPCRLDYQVVCDSGWRTRSANVLGWLGETIIDIELAVDAQGRWRLNGVERPEVRGCIDLDLNFSPSTNLIPIRRLNLTTGKAAEVTAAWLRFPSFQLEPLPQLYRRVDSSTYRYESGGGQFVVDLQVNPAGFVTSYPGGWEAEAVTLAGARGHS
jgi:uncharacterized protein